jgi:hypothetical protein
MTLIVYHLCAVMLGVDSFITILNIIVFNVILTIILKLSVVVPN